MKPKHFSDRAKAWLEGHPRSQIWEISFSQPEFKFLNIFKEKELGNLEELNHGVPGEWRQRWTSASDRRIVIESYKIGPCWWISIHRKDVVKILNHFIDQVNKYLIDQYGKGAAKLHPYYVDIFDGEHDLNKLDDHIKVNLN